MTPRPTDETTHLLKDGLSGSSETPSHLHHKKFPSSLPSQRPSLCHWLSLVTVEPALFCHMMTFWMEMVFKTNMLVDKTCSTHYHYSSDVCDNLDSGRYEEQEDAVQSLTNLYTLYCQWVDLCPAVVVIILLGTVSDTYSRRLPMLLTIFGAILKAVGLFLNAYWWSWEPYYIIISYIPSGLTGSTIAVFMAGYAYVSEVSDAKWRTTRLSLVGIMLYTAMPIGQLLGAFIFSRWGYTAVFGCDVLLNILAFLYILARIKDSKPKTISRELEDGGRESVCRGILKKLKQSVMVVVKKRENGVRSQIFGHIACVCLYFMTYGVTNFIFLYTRKKFEWTYNNYTLLMIITAPFNILGLCVLLPLLSNNWRVEDAIISFIGTASHSFFGILLGTAPAPWAIYIGLLVSAGGGMTITASRGALSKLVASDELGAVFSVIGLGESFIPIFSAPLYTFIYNKTLEVFPGTIFILASVISLFICCLYTWLATAFLPHSKREDM